MTHNVCNYPNFSIKIYCVQSTLEPAK